MNRKKLKYGGFSLLVTAIFLAGIILLNIMAGMLTSRFFLKADLTSTGMYSLSEDAAKMLEGINEPVDVIVLADESSWLMDTRWNRIVDILQNYSVVSGGQIRVQYVNPDLNTFTDRNADGSEFKNSLTSLKETYPDLSELARDDIIFKSGRRATKISVSIMYSWSYDSNYNSVATAIKADQELVSVLTYVLSEEVARAVFLEGHNESAAEYLSYLFEKCGYDCVTTNIAFEPIPEDATIVISVAPKTDFSADEILKLGDYLTKGGNAMIFYDYETISLPLLDQYMAQWGIDVESKLVCDEQYSYFSQYTQSTYLGAKIRGQTSILPTLAASEEKGMYVGLPLPRSIAVSTAREYTTYPILETFSSSSYTKDFSAGQLDSTERAPEDAAGPFVIGTFTEKMTYDKDGGSVYNHLIVANAGLVDDDFLYYYGSNFYNVQMMADLANDINPFGESVYIASKALAGGEMPVNEGQARTVLLLLVIALPLIIILLGILVWRRRKHL